MATPTSIAVTSLGGKVAVVIDGSSDVFTLNQSDINFTYNGSNSTIDVWMKKPQYLSFNLPRASVSIGGTAITSKAIFDAQVAAVFINAGLTAIPTRAESLVLLTGEIIFTSGNYYFVDRSGNARHFLITGYDFNADWTKGFPYKSAATISAPAGDATLISADLNNFLYASGGTPNQIPVVSLFQDVDYEHKMFSRHQAAQLDANGVEILEARVMEFVVYNSVRTGINLTKCQRFFRPLTEITSNIIWVSKTGNDTTGTGSKAAPVLTIQKAYDLGALNPIYVKTGVYLENNGSSYLTPTRVKTCTALGRVEVNAASTSALLTTNAAAFTMNNVIFNARNTNNNVIQDAGTVTKTIAFNRCYFTGGKTSFVTQTSYVTTQFTNCVMTGNAITNVSQCHSNLFNSCYVNTFSHIMYRNPVWQNCKLLSVTMSNGGNPTMAFSGNKISATIALVNSSSTAAFDFLYNTVTLKSGSYNLITSGAIATTTAQLNAKYNKFTSEAGASGACLFLNSSSTQVYNNVFNLRLGTYAAGSVATTVAGADNGIKIRNNYIHSNVLNSGVISINGEVNYTTAKGAEFTGNTVISFRYDNPTATGTGHAVQITTGGNEIIAYNKITHCNLGLVNKHGEGLASVSGGVYGNVFEDNCVSIWNRGVGALNVFNNTIKYGLTAYTSPFLFGIRADENAAQPGTQNSENVIVKNNIINVEAAAGTLIQFDAWADAHGCIAENNVLNGGVYLFNDGTTNYSSLATAQLAGKLLNCVVQNPLLSATLIPATMIDGANLGDAYKTGLAVTTKWGDAANPPVTVTKDQAGTWQAGAFVQ